MQTWCLPFHANNRRNQGIESFLIIFIDLWVATVSWLACEQSQIKEYTQIGNCDEHFKFTTLYKFMHKHNH